MTINFYCTCGQLMTVKPEYAGRAGNCPRCRAPFTVPAQSEPAAAPPARPPQQQTAPAPPKTTTAFNTPSIPTPNMGGAVAGHGPRLEVVHGPGNLQGQVFPLAPGRATIIGRDPGVDLTIPSDRVSRRHCQLGPTPQGYVLEDLGSANGTLINQVRLQGRRVLTGGEYIQTGDCLFRFCEQ